MLEDENTEPEGLRRCLRLRKVPNEKVPIGHVRELKMMSESQITVEDQVPKTFKRCRLMVMGKKPAPTSPASSESTSMGRRSPRCSPERE